MKRCYFVLVVLLAIGVSAQAALVPVPNGDFELIYLPGSTSVTGTMNGWTMGAGPGTNQHPDGGLVDFSDGSTGTVMDIPGWINAPDWPISYNWDKGSASIGSQPAQVPPSGTNYLTANGGGWGNGGGGAVESDATLTTVEAGLTYTISALVDGPITPVVLDLLANDVVITPSSVVDPGTYAWDTVSKTYDAADLTAYLGQSLRIRAGWGPEALQSQSRMDMVTMTAVPEPATMLLLGLGGLLIRRKRS